MDKYLTGAKGKAPMREAQKGSRSESAGRTFRAPHAHVTRTNEKNPGIVTKVPVDKYNDASPNSKDGMLNIIDKDVQALRAANEKNDGKRKVADSGEIGIGAVELKKEAPARGESSKASITPKYNRRGNRIPDASPENLLTGDRTGDEHAKVLVSPESYGRTERALRQATSISGSPKRGRFKKNGSCAIVAAPQAIVGIAAPRQCDKCTPQRILSALIAQPKPQKCLVALWSCHNAAFDDRRRHR